MKRIFPLLVLLLAACADDEPGGHPVILVGIDGADWQVIDTLIARGELPNFSRIKAEGAWGPLVNPGPQVSPVVWTTFATGHFGRDHGILDFVYPYVPGPKRPVESVLRREPAIWNVATRYGLRSTVVGYYVSYPADVINGVMVTDRVMQNLDGSVYPEDRRAYVQDMARSVKSRRGREEVLERFFPWDYDPDDADDPASPYAEATRVVAGRLDNALVKDELLRRMTLELMEEPADLFITYFRLVDYAGHSLWLYWDDSDFDAPPDASEKELLGDAIPETYRFMDEILGALLARFDDTANLLVVSDHGMASATGLFATDENRTHVLTGNHRPDGVFMALGPDIRPGRVEGLTVMEIMPALAALLDLPVSNHLPGRVPEELMSDAFLTSHPVEYMSDYGGVEWTHVGGGEISRDAQEETMRGLQGLGYIAGDVELEGSAVAREYDFWETEPRLLISHLSGEVMYYLLRGEVEIALDIHEEATAHDRRYGRRLRQQVKTKRQTLNDRLGVGYLAQAPFAAWLESTGGRTEGKNPEAGKK